MAKSKPEWRYCIGPALALLAIIGGLILVALTAGDVPPEVVHEIAR